jgi:hypothetical protein
MELADARMIQELLAGHARISRVGVGCVKDSMLAGRTVTRGPKARRCRCGVCSRCLEEARWERIFKERFADPDYYGARPVHFGSSMGWLSAGDALS